MVGGGSGLYFRVRQSIDVAVLLDDLDDELFHE